MIQPEIQLCEGTIPISKNLQSKTGNLHVKYCLQGSNAIANLAIELWNIAQNLITPQHLLDLRTGILCYVNINIKN